MPVPTSIDRRVAGENWFAEQKAQPELSAAERARLLSFVGNPDFGLLWGYLYSEQLGYHVQLANRVLGTAADAAAASVLQGKIHGLARVKDSLLDLLETTDPTTMEKSNG